MPSVRGRVRRARTRVILVALLRSTTALGDRQQPVPGPLRPDVGPCRTSRCRAGACALRSRSRRSRRRGPASRRGRRRRPRCAGRRPRRPAGAGPAARWRCGSAPTSRRAAAPTGVLPIGLTGRSWACARAATRRKWVTPQTAAVWTMSTAPAASSGRNCSSPVRFSPVATDARIPRPTAARPSASQRRTGSSTQVRSRVRSSLADVADRLLAGPATRSRRASGRAASRAPASVSTSRTSVSRCRSRSTSRPPLSLAARRPRSA